jgi:hypothetical protein
VRAVSVVEAFALDLGEATVRARLRSATQNDSVDRASKEMVEYLLNEKWSTLTTGAWDRLINLWTDGLEIKVRQGFGDWQEVGLLRETRHAIVHRVGEYTPGYRKKARARLRAMGIDADRASGLIPLTEADVDRAIALAHDFVFWLDAEARA